MQVIVIYVSPAGRLHDFLIQQPV
jgi:hypothetical protein